jgi:hypothetical protein
MKLNKSALFFIAAIAIANSCTQKSDQRGTVKRLPVGAVLNSNRIASDKAEELAGFAESLLTAQGFAEAHKTALLALEQDPQNLRAKFVKALTAPVVIQKGIFARVRPLAEKHPQWLENYETRIAKMKAEPSNFNTYLLDGQPDISTAEVLQLEFDKAIQSLEELRVFAKSSKDSELTLKANSLLVPDAIERYAESCEIKETQNLEYELICPSPETRFHVTMNRADFEILQDMATYYKIQFSFVNSYELVGAGDVAEYVSTLPYNNPQLAADSLLTNKNFGRLRPQSRLEEIKTLGLDIVTSLNWFMSQQATVCPMGSMHPRNRVGMWINSGMCVGGWAKQYIELMDMFFNSKPIDLTREKNGATYVTQQVGFKLIEDPLKNVRELGPLKFDKCGSLMSVGDPTLHGVFPKGDSLVALEFMAMDCPQ